MIEQDVMKTVNPTTGKPLKEYSLMTNEEASAAVKRCHDAFVDWKKKSLEERAEVIKAIGKNLAASKKEFAQLMTNEMGKLRSQGEQEIELCAKICEHTAESGSKELQNEPERELPGGGRGIIKYSPIGVVYGIQPWNFPAYQVIRYAIANLMAGNGVLLKHAESVTGSAIKVKEVFEEAGLPKDLFTVLLINHDQSDEIIKNDFVRGVTLTGSSKAGRHVAKVAGENLKKTVLELGSNDAYLVLDDADLETAVDWSVKGRIYNNGETCVAAKRFVVTEKNYDKFLEAFTEKMSKIKFGNPNDEDTQLGPIVREDLRDKLHEQVEESVKKGAKVLCGGGIPEQDGFFYPATVLANVEPGQPAYDDELFGPVASVIKAKDDEDAMRIANDSRFGLGGGIFSKNEKYAIELAEKHFDTGMVFINGFDVAQPNMPFGGVKNSGYGREHGGFGIKEFVNAKAINILK
ncbi:NAD-dependent succinate-semialdehyde dehydrogenase [Zunongwangia sp.]|uniref:NAD-dependent succinate-semialdehyde dehydrogenase n=1 Tax=Zunongwangia sp. TaxID=1965325 RepID=UPI003AA88FAC